MNRAAVAAHPAKEIVAVTDAPSPAEMPVNPEIKKKKEGRTIKDPLQPNKNHETLRHGPLQAV